MVLAERGRKISDEEVSQMNAKIVIEALPGILTAAQINMLRAAGKRYIPAYCIYGGTFYGIREKLMHSIIPQETRHVGDIFMHMQSGVRESAVAVMSEVLDRIPKRNWIRQGPVYVPLQGACVTG